VLAHQDGGRWAGTTALSSHSGRNGNLCLENKADCISGKQTTVFFPRTSLRRRGTIGRGKCSPVHARSLVGNVLHTALFNDVISDGAVTLHKLDL
jgi:hypothetical protein